jgi:hypothetical protein
VIFKSSHSFAHRRREKGESDARAWRSEHVRDKLNSLGDSDTGHDNECIDNHDITVVFFSDVLVLKPLSHFCPQEYQAIV